MRYSSIVSTSKYQIIKSWEIPNIDELFDDILEAMDTKVSQYIGTFILSEQNGNSGYYDLTDLSEFFASMLDIVRKVKKSENTVANAGAP
ncbi:hypothetical protein QP794_01080 [Paenibacillus sp. UMB7766-LJ446]|uniref:hypothetical protein n=1 Tax=Paenibacillus sp. UMB7766-LJ446 TaxID=3046313 RepID=UPI00254D05D3|nr:hypothetical protein [Paenibacillus sp. UMB7766-LJ446]MDK8188673.1 hypothetical protein [Paenibacillus sp. UMB7766-LJ446]